MLMNIIANNMTPTITTGILSFNHNEQNKQPTTRMNGKKNFQNVSSTTNELNKILVCFIVYVRHTYIIIAHKKGTTIAVISDYVQMKFHELKSLEFINCDVEPGNVRCDVGLDWHLPGKEQV